MSRPTRTVSTAKGRVRGRPSTYSRKKADAVLELMMDGASIRGACKTVGVANGTFYRWLAEDVDGIAGRYTRAQEIQALVLVDECLDIADDASNDWIERVGREGKPFVTLNHEHIRRNEIRIAHRRWYFEQVRAKAFKREQEAGAANASEAFEALGRIAAALQARPV